MLVGTSAIDAVSYTAALPVELLTSIFSYLARSNTRQTDLVSATHVCNFWRTVALCHATLWANVFATSPSKALAFFERSKEVLLDVHIASTCDLESIVQLLRTHSSRLRTLHVDAADAACAARYLTHFSQFTAPQLHSFRLDGPDVSAADAAVMLSVHQDFYAFQLQQPESRDSELPSFQTVQMRPFCIPWSASIYRNLSILDLRVPCVPTTCMNQLLHILRQCPDLESFRVHSSPLVHLPKLNSFHIEGPPPGQIAELLRHISLPDTTRYTFSTSETRDRPSDYSILPSDRTHLPGFSSLRAIEFSQVDSNNVILTAYNAAMPDVPVVTLTVNVADPGTAATRIASTFNVSAVETLTFALPAVPTKTDLTSAVPHLLLWDFTSVRTLRLIRYPTNSIRSLLGALRTPPSQSLCERRGVDISVAGLMCPKLETLAMLQVAPPCRLSTDLKWFCDERRKANCPLACLQTELGALPQVCLDALRAREVKVAFSA
ncbi:hypothetical protein C8Q74DRAFT_1224910 [Fomes fomentarius]|nr:hypothetical protein C8Q74DRAFT_1224910 [Fomes fomentarius]